MGSSLLVHKGARLVGREELARIDAPPPTDTWFPLSHSAVLDRVAVTLSDAGFRPRKVSMALSPDNARFFGTIDLDSAVAPGVSLAIGIRNSIDKSLPISMVAGNHVLVCDNMAFRSEILVVRRHTRNGETRFGSAICQAVGNLNQFQVAEAVRIKNFQEAEIEDETAESLILRAYEKKLISHHVLPQVISEWRRPSYEEFAPRTLWSLTNAFTTALAPVGKVNPQRFCGLTIAVQGLLADEATQREPQYSTPA